MERHNNIYQYLSELRQSGVFTPLDLEELEDHLEEEVKFQSNYLEKEAAHEKAVQLLGTSKNLVSAYRKRNIWKTLEHYGFHLLAGFTFMLILSESCYLFLLFLMALIQPIPGTAVFIAFPILSFLVMLLITYGLKRWLFQPKWSLQPLLERERLTKRLWWMLPLYKVGLSILLMIVTPIAFGSGNHVLLFHTGLAIIAAPFFWILLGTFNWLSSRRSGKVFANHAFAALLFLLGTAVYTYGFKGFTYFLTIRLPEMVPNFGVFASISMLVLLGIISSFGWMALRKKKLEKKSINW